MRKVLLLVYSIITVLIFTFTVYNITSIAQYIGFNDSRVLSIKPDSYLFYVITFFFYFINYRVSVTIFKQSLIISFISIIITTIVIDFSVLFTGRELMPLRFPFATLFPVLGSLLGLCSYSLQRTSFWIIAFIFGTGIFFSLTFLLPSIILRMQERQIEGFEFNTIDKSSTFIDTSGTKFLFEDLNANKVILVDFYFVNCPPCELKIDALKMLNEKVSHSKFQIILVCDGRISTYSDFKSHAIKNRYSGFMFLYDNMKVKQSVTNLESYPFEIILNKNGEIVSKNIGFDGVNKRKYIENNLSIINKFL